MKIAIPANGKEMNSSIEAHFGRAAGFLVYDDQKKDSEYILNGQDPGSVQGAGIQAAKRIADAGADILIVANIGPKAYSAITEAGIDIYYADAQSIEETLLSLHENRLEKAREPNTRAHQG